MVLNIVIFNKIHPSEAHRKSRHILGLSNEKALFPSLNNHCDVLMPKALILPYD